MKNKQIIIYDEFEELLTLRSKKPLFKVIKKNMSSLKRKKLNLFLQKCKKSRLNDNTCQ